MKAALLRSCKMNCTEVQNTKQLCIGKDTNDLRSFVCTRFLRFSDMKYITSTCPLLTDR